MQERESKKERKRKRKKEKEKKERRKKERERTRAHTKKRVRGTPDIICTFTETIQISSNPFPSSVFSTSDNAPSFASFSSCMASVSKAVCIGEVTVITWFSRAETTSLR